MSLASTSRAVGAVSSLLKQQLALRTDVEISVGKPEPEGASPPNPRLNVYLYETALDPSLRNVPLDEGQRPPLWLILRYIITAFDLDGRSDTPEAHRLVGSGLRALQELSFLPIDGIDSADLDALKASPEPLKITFNDIAADLLSKITQGSKETYRFSTSFEVRPVLVAPAELPAYSLLVGIDYSTPKIIGEEGVEILVEASMGLLITDVEPSSIEPGEEIAISGANLDQVDLPARLGPLKLTAALQDDGKLAVKTSRAAAPPETHIDPTKISAGYHTLTVSKNLAPNRTRSSPPEIVAVRPIVDAAVIDGATLADDTSPGFAGRRTCVVEIDGFLLGRDSDDAFVSMLKDGSTAAMTDVFDGGGSQAQRRAVFGPRHSLPPGDYRMVLRVNGVQARQSPTVTVAP